MSRRANVQTNIWIHEKKNSSTRKKLRISQTLAVFTMKFKVSGTRDPASKILRPGINCTVEMILGSSVETASISCNDRFQLLKSVDLLVE